MVCMPTSPGTTRIAETEPVMALRKLDQHTQLHEGVCPATLGTHKSYHRQAIVRDCRQRGLSPRHLRLQHNWSTYNPVWDSLAGI
jgi:hypothetical protein